MIKWNPTQSPNPDPNGSPEGEILNPGEFLEHSSLVVVAKDGATVLQKHFPGWPWAIQINSKGRMINVFNHALHDTWGYTIRANEVEHGETRSVFLRAGGEILERFGLPRRGFDAAAYMALPRDPTNRCIPYINDLEHAQARKAMKKRKIVEAIKAGRVVTGADGKVFVAV